MASKRVGGLVIVKSDGVQFQAKGSFTYRLSIPKKEAVIGSDSFHGYKEMPVEGFIEGAITDSEKLDLAALIRTTGAVVTLNLANGKTIVCKDAFYSADGDVTTEEGEIQFRFSGETEEI